MPAASDSPSSETTPTGASSAASLEPAFPLPPGSEDSSASTGSASPGSAGPGLARTGSGGTGSGGTSDESSTASASPSKAPASSAGTSRTRTSGAYVTVGVTLLLLVVVLDFIIQNLKRASIHFFTLDFRLPIGILMLGGAVGGGLIVLMFSLFRVLQLRRTNRRQRKEASNA